MTPADQLLNLLNPQSFPDTPWARHLADGQRDAALDAFMHELRTGPSRTSRPTDIPELYARWLGKHIGFSGGHRFDPDLVIQRHYVGVYGFEHKFTGDVDWHFDPTAAHGQRQTKEWVHQFNRHYQWVPLALRYEETGDPKYARYWEYELQTWLSQCPRDPGPHIKDPAWSPINVGIRAGWSWPLAFDVFRKCPDISDQTLIQMLVSFYEHGVHLLHVPTGRNWKAMEANGLGHVGFMFPEFNFAKAMASTAVDRVLAELERQVYDDGTQDELAPSYAVVSLSNFWALLCLAEARPMRDAGVPARAWRRCADMAHALARVADRRGVMPPLHDSPPTPVAGLFNEFASRLSAVDDTPWTRDALDVMLWGGYAISRRPTERSWVLLDAGPFGAAHQHHDALQVLLTVGEHELLIDPGKPHYDVSKLTVHLKSSAAHNVVQVDGRRHQADELIIHANSPLPIRVGKAGPIRAMAATRRAVTCEEPVVRFTHRRMLLDLEGIGWFIVDRLHADDDAPHHWEWLWHTQAQTLEVTDDGAIARFADASYAIAVRGSTPLRFQVHAGQTEPVIRGWRAGNDENEPAPTPTLGVTSSPVAGPVWAATLLSPQPRSFTADDGMTFRIDRLELRLIGEADVDAVELRSPGQPVVVCTLATAME